MWHGVVYLNGEQWCDPKGDDAPRIDPEEIDLLIPIFK